MNIFDNCRKYNKFDSDVVIHQWIQKGTNDAIITIVNQPRVTIDTTDMPRLFDLGFRGSNGRRIIASGTGLGLYISKKIVEDVHGGSMNVQTVRGSGLIFTIHLPGGPPDPTGKGDR